MCVSHINNLLWGSQLFLRAQRNPNTKKFESCWSSRLDYNLLHFRYYRYNPLYGFGQWAYDSTFIYLEEGTGHKQE